MSRLRAIAAVLSADLRQRSRSPRFWVVVLALGAAMWWCFPPTQADYLTVSVGDGLRGRYSSAWIGMVVAVVYSSLLSLAGFYLVRGTVTRDLQTHAWELLVTTTMSRAGYLAAKWLSHMVVFSVVIAVGLAIGVFAQLLRGEDMRLDLVELFKPSLLLALPSLGMTAALAVWFDLVPWLRRTAGNALFFILWTMMLGFGVSQAERAPGSALPWPGDVSGLLVAEDALTRGLSDGEATETSGLSVGMQSLNGTVPTVGRWDRWPVAEGVIAGRFFWLALGLALLLAATPLLDRFAAQSGGGTKSRTNGARLRWLDALLRPLQGVALGGLIAAELKLILRPRRLLWWISMAALLVAQMVVPDKAMAVAMVGAWMLSLDVFARLVLRERETRTGELVFTAPRILWRLLAARSVVVVGLALLVVAPALVRLMLSEPLMALAALVSAVSIALWGLAAGAVCRNSRLFELALLLAGYVSVQGAWLINAMVDPSTTLFWHAVLLPVASIALIVAWPRLAGVRG